MLPPPIDCLRARLESAHAKLAEESRTRCLVDVSHGGSGLLDFSSNDYLGLRMDKRLSEAGARAALRYGSGSGASRLVHATDGAAFELEEFTATQVGAEKALLLASGFMANLAIFDALSPFEFEGDLGVEIFLDARAHASLFLGARLAGTAVHFFRHKDYAQLHRKLTESGAETKIVVVEALHSMDGDFEDLEALAGIAAATRALLVVDEAHTFGIAGPGGRGLVAALPSHAKQHVLASMLGCGKAVGVNGGIVAAPEWFLRRMVQKSRSLIYTTAPTAFVAGAVRASLDILFSPEGDALRQGLERVSAGVGSWLQERGVPHVGDRGSPIFGVLCGSEARALAASEKVKERGFLLRAIRPPTVPRGTSRLRVVCRSSHEHSPAILEDLCVALREATIMSE